jgi:hypothetical protein
MGETDNRIALKFIFEKWGRRVSTGFYLLRIASSDELL